MYEALSTDLCSGKAVAGSRVDDNGLNNQPTSCCHLWGTADELGMWGEGTAS